jgi:lipopolysaccharide biosynthesis regulator YciM
LEALASPTSLASVLEEPVFIQIVLALLVTALIVWAVRRLLRIAHRLDQRRALREFVRGMDHFLRGAHEEAAAELEKVLERDPENVEARIALGDSLRALGQAAEAHRHHYEVRQVFGHDLPRNDLSLGRDHLALGDLEAAIPDLERALSRGIEHDGAERELRDAYLETRRYEKAVELGRRVLDRARDDAAREEARRTLSRALTLAAGEALENDAPRQAGTWLEEAIKLSPELVQARMELVKAKILTSGPQAGARAFSQALREMRRLADGGEIVFEPVVGGPAPEPLAGAEAATAGSPTEPRLLDAPDRPRLDAPPAEDEAHAVIRHDGATTAVERREDASPALPSDVLAPEDMAPLLDRAAQVFCEKCGRTARDWAELCPGCGALGTLRPRDPSRLKRIPDPKGLLEEIEENRAWVRKLCRQLAAGIEEAAQPLARAGRRAVPLVFREALAAADPRPLIDCISRMGDRVVDDMLDAWRRSRSVLQRRVWGEKARRRSADEIVVASLVRMGTSVEPALREMLEHPEPDVRGLALEALLRIGSLELVEEARLLFSGRDVVDRLNAMDPPVVRDVIEAAAPESHLVQVIFPDRTFRHEEALVDVLASDEDREKVLSILKRRGFSPGVVTALLPHADDPELRDVVFDLIDSFGPVAADHLLTAVVDPELGSETRAHAARVLLRFGVPSLDKLLDGASDRPGTMGDMVVDLVASIGDAAVPELSRAYAAGGWLSKIGLGREKIHARRALIIRSLVRVGSEAAVMALREIRMRETDPGLRHEAESALSELETA